MLILQWSRSGGLTAPSLWIVHSPFGQSRNFLRHVSPRALIPADDSHVFIQEVRNRRRELNFGFCGIWMKYLLMLLLRPPAFASQTQSMQRATDLSSDRNQSKRKSHFSKHIETFHSRAMPSIMEVAKCNSSKLVDTLGNMVGSHCATWDPLRRDVSSRSVKISELSLQTRLSVRRSIW
jgi:hypothetical protein